MRGRIRQADADAGERDDRLTTDELEEPAQLRRMNEVERADMAFPPRGSTRPR
ncbi:hypothetical protein ACWC9U_36815 [Streptomyces sp. 900116325]